MDNYFSNKTKAEVLSDLSKKKLKFKIPKTLFFNVNEWNSEKNIPNSLCELPKLETARDYDFLVWKEKSFHSIWGK